MQYNGELYAAFRKDESLPKRNLLILSQLVDFKEKEIEPEANFDGDVEVRNFFKYKDL